MPAIDGNWLAEQMERVARAPSNSRSLVAGNVHVEAVQGYLVNVRIHLEAGRREALETNPKVLEPLS